MARNPIDRAVSDFIMLSEEPFVPELKGCIAGHNVTFAEVAAEEIGYGVGDVTADRRARKDGPSCEKRLL